MPTLEDLGKLVKTKFPGKLDDVSDLEVGQRFKAKYPDQLTEFRGSGGDVAKQARKNLANNLQQGAAETYAQDMADVKGKAIKEGALLVGAAAAAPFTGGASLLPAVGISAAAGGAASLVGQVGQIAVGSSEAPQSLGDMTRTAGWDAASFALGEAGGRAIGATLKSLVPKLAIRSAAKIDRGIAVLDGMYTDTSKELYSTIASDTAAKAASVGNPPGTALVQTAGRRATKALLSGATETIPNIPTKTGAPWVDAAPELRYIVDGINSLPRAAGKFGERFGGPTSKAAEMIAGMSEDLGLNASKGTIGAFQPLDGLIRAQHSLQTAAWKEGALGAEERTIFKRGAETLQAVIKDALKDVGPEAVALYNRTNDIVKAQVRNEFAVKLSQEWAASIFKKGFLPALGAGYGYYSGGGLQGALTGAAVGAGLPYVSSFALEQAVKHPQATKLLGKAIDLMFEGKGASARALAGRAFAVAGGREAARDFFAHQKGELSGTLGTQQANQSAEQPSQ